MEADAGNYMPERNWRRQNTNSSVILDYQCRIYYSAHCIPQEIDWLKILSILLFVPLPITNRSWPTFLDDAGFSCRPFWAGCIYPSWFCPCVRCLDLYYGRIVQSRFTWWRLVLLESDFSSLLTLIYWRFSVLLHRRFAVTIRRMSVEVDQACRISGICLNYGTGTFSLFSVIERSFQCTCFSVLWLTFCCIVAEAHRQSLGQSWHIYNI